ncbi:SpoIIE family protein phosphatase [Streptomyces capparidis]
MTGQHSSRRPTPPAAAPQGPPAPQDPRTADAVEALADELRRAHAARSERSLLDLATGVLVAQLGCSPEEAAEHVERLAARSGLSRPEFAADIVNQAAGDVVARASDSPGAAARLRGAAAGAASAEDLADLAASLLEEALRPLGANALALWRRTATGCLRLVGQAGLGATERAHWHWVPPQLDTPLHDAAGTAEDLWFPAGPPPGRPLPGASPDSARAVLPLTRTGEPVGVALVAWPRPAPLDEAVRRQLLALLSVAAQVMDGLADAPAESFGLAPVRDLLDLLVHPALLLRAEGGAGAYRVEHANPAAAQSSATPPRAAGRPLAEVLPAVHADLAALADRARATGVPQRAAALPCPPSPDGLVPPGAGTPAGVRVLPAGDRAVALWRTHEGDGGPAMLRIAHRLGGIGAFEDDPVAGSSTWTEHTYALFERPEGSEPVPLERMRPHLHPGDGALLTELLDALHRRHESVNAVVRLIREGGSVRHIRVVAEPVVTDGVLTAVVGLYQDVSAQHHTEVALAATYSQLTTVEQHAATRRRLALQLQQVIMPETPRPRELPGLQIAARYRPAAEEYRVGGDWYDVMLLPTGSTLLTVGDVSGHGIDAATGMVVLRNALRGLAVTGEGPGRLLEWLNRVSAPGAARTGTAPSTTATAVCGLFDPRTRTLRWATAGHLPPLLLRDGSATLLRSPRNILLGAMEHAEYREAETVLRPGDTLLLYTDGLVERRRTAIDETLATLVRQAQSLSGDDLQAHADRLLELAGGDTDDDTCLVAVRVT